MVTRSKNRYFEDVTFLNSCRFVRTATPAPGFEEEQKSKGPFTYDARKILGFLTPSPLSTFHATYQYCFPAKIWRFLFPDPLPLVHISRNLSVLFSCQNLEISLPSHLSVQTSYVNVPEAGGVQNQLGVGEPSGPGLCGKVCGQSYWQTICIIVSFYWARK